jgi:hypothetical protein
VRPSHFSESAGASRVHHVGDCRSLRMRGDVRLVWPRLLAPKILRYGSSRAAGSRSSPRPTHPLARSAPVSLHHRPLHAELACASPLLSERAHPRGENRAPTICAKGMLPCCRDDLERARRRGRPRLLVAAARAPSSASRPFANDSARWRAGDAHDERLHGALVESSPRHRIFVRSPESG